MSSSLRIVCLSPGFATINDSTAAAESWGEYPNRRGRPVPENRFSCDVLSSRVMNCFWFSLGGVDEDESDERMRLVR